jgi:agmatine/peptidylarginine deiminase
MNMKELAAKMVAELKDGAEILDGIKAVKEAWASESNILKKAFKAVSAAVAVIADVVERVEVLGADLKAAGGNKKELAVEVINSLVDIPWVPEAVEAHLIEFAVDAIVGAFNKKFGKDWLGKIA